MPRTGHDDRIFASPERLPKTISYKLRSLQRSRRLFFQNVSKPRSIKRSNGLNKVVLCDLVIVEILPVLEKESKFKKAQGLLVTGFFRPPPPPPTRCCIWWKFFSIRIWIKESPSPKKPKERAKINLQIEKVDISKRGGGERVPAEGSKTLPSNPNSF